MLALYRRVRDVKMGMEQRNDGNEDGQRNDGNGDGLGAAQALFTSLLLSSFLHRLGMVVLAST